MIDVWGADHGGYVKRMQAAVKAVTGEGALDVKLCQMVRLLRNGEPVKMSKRSGDFVTLREVIDEVGRDAVRFMMIYRKNDATLDFDSRQGRRTVEGQPGLLCAVCPCALRLDLPAGPRGVSGR
jgi:arginyl-tRNA synthetase